jgi:hypothetical protein
MSGRLWINGGILLMLILTIIAAVKVANTVTDGEMLDALADIGMYILITYYLVLLCSGLVLPKSKTFNIILSIFALMPILGFLLIMV